MELQLPGKAIRPNKKAAPYLSPDLDDNYFNPNEILTQTSVNSRGTTQFVFTYTYKSYPTSMTIIAGGANNYYYYSYNDLTD